MAAQIGEAYIILGAKLGQLRADMRAARNVAASEINGMQEEITASSQLISKGMVPVQTAAIEQAASFGQLRTASSLMVVGLSQVGVQGRGTAAAFKILTLGTYGLSVAMKGLATAVKAFFISIGPVGWVIAAVTVVVLALVYAYDKLMKGVKKAAEAMDEFSSTAMTNSDRVKSIQEDLDNQLMVARGQTDAKALKDLQKQGADREKEIQSMAEADLEAYKKTVTDKAVIDKWQIGNIRRAEEAVAKVRADTQELISRKQKEFEDRDRKSNVEAIQKKADAMVKFSEETKQTHKTITDLTSGIKLFYAEFTGQDQVAEQMKQTQEINKYKDAIDELRMSGKVSPEDLRGLDDLYAKLNKLSGMEDKRKAKADQRKISAVQAGYSETSASLRNIAISPEFSANVTGAAQEGTAKNMLNQLIRIGDAVTGRRGAVAAPATWQ